jgi:hypothetical protein
VASDPLADLRKDLAAPPTPEAEAPAEPRASRDPVTRVMQTITPPLDRAGLLGAKEGWLRQVGGAFVPQTSPQAALTALMFVQPEAAAARWGLPLAEKLAASGVMPALSRAALRGLAVGGVGAMTGHNPRESALEGAAGSLVGEGAGKVMASWAQSAGAKLALGNVTNDLAKSLEATIGPYLPEKASPERILRAVANGEATDAVSAKLTALKQAHARTPVSIIDLEPVMSEAGVVYTPKGALPGEATPTPWKLTPGRALAPRHSLTKEAPLGEVLDSIQATRAKWQGSTDPAAPVRLVQLRELEDTLASRADPTYQKLLRDYGRTKQLRNWLVGSDSPDPPVGERTATTLFDGRTGRLSWEGYTTLAKRLGMREPRLSPKSFAPEEITRFGEAMRLDLERGGMVTGEEGRGAIKSLGVGKLGVPYVHPQMPRAAWMPGWERDAGIMRARLAPAAVRAITGQGPLHAEGLLGRGETRPQEAQE